MFKTSLWAIALISFFSFISFAQEETKATEPVLKVDEMAICTSVEERQPVGTDTAFIKTIGKLYCFVKVSAESDSTSIFQTWIYKDKEMAKVELSVKGKTWRTWSSKRIVEDWVGNWKVEVSNASGDVLKTVEFVIK